MSLVSVIVPVYNVQEYLTDCIESLVSQTYASVEIILVDDGSTDQSGVICDNYVERYPGRIQVIHKPNEGLNYARRDGFLACSGDLVAFVDSDDVVASDFIEVFREIIMNNGAIVAMGGYRRFERLSDINLELSDSVGVVFEENKSTILRWLIEGGAPWGEHMFMMTAWGKIYKREVFESIDWAFSNYKANEDEFWMMQVLNNIVGGIVVTDARLYGYRRNRQSITYKPYLNEFSGKPLNKFEFIIQLYEKSLIYLGDEFSEPLARRLGFNTVDFIEMYTDQRSMNRHSIASAQKIINDYGDKMIANQADARVLKKIKKMKQFGVFWYVICQRLSKMLRR